MARMRSKAERAVEYRILHRMLGEERAAQGLSLEDVGQRLGRGKSTVWKWERGELRLDLVELSVLSDAIGFDLADFVSRFQKEARAAVLPDKDPKA